MRPSIFPETLTMIVADYRLSARQREREINWWKAEGEPFSEVIDRAARARMHDGKRHSHQYRLTRVALDGCVTALHAISDELQAAPDFHRLLCLVSAAFDHIRGAGELAAYDVADRLRHRLNLASQHLVYLHAGTRIGARRLIGGRLPNHEAWSIMHDDLPQALRVLDNHEAEDVLCSYREQLLLTPQALKAQWGGKRASRCGGPAETRPSC